MTVMIDFIKPHLRYTMSRKLTLAQRILPMIRRERPTEESSENYIRIYAPSLGFIIKIGSWWGD